MKIFTAKGNHRIPTCNPKGAPVGLAADGKNIYAALEARTASPVPPVEGARFTGMEAAIHKYNFHGVSAFQLWHIEASAFGVDRAKGCAAAVSEDGRGERRVDRLEWFYLGTPTPEEAERLLASIETAQREQQEAAAAREQQEADRKAARAARLAEIKAKSQHVGTVGERREFTLSIRKIISLGVGQWGERFLTIAKSGDDTVIYFGKFNPVFNEKGEGRGVGEGDTITVKATIKEHGARDGEKQTVVARPQVLGFAGQNKS